MTNLDIIKLENEYTMQTYNRIPVVVERGEGAIFYDVDGKKYIDFTAGIGVNCFGSCDKGWLKAVTDQLNKFQHCSNYYYNVPAAELAEKLTDLSRLERTFLCNSGAEANECAIKIARKYSLDKYGEGRNTIITLKKSFHGRTITTLSATGQDKFHQFFDPFTPGFVHCPPNDSAALEKMLDGTVCAIMAEPILGEGGIIPLEDEFMKDMRRICDENDILLIFDEVQCGVGRSGHIFAWQESGIRPDIMTLAKGLGGGLPIGAALCNSKCAGVLSAGMNGSTFGGNPVVCAGANEILDRMTAVFLDEITEKGEYIKKRINDAAPKRVIGIRGRGLMLGFQVNGIPSTFVKAAAQKGLLILSAGTDVIRLLPPLTITKEEIDQGLEILIEVLNK